MVEEKLLELFTTEMKRYGYAEDSIAFAEAKSSFILAMEQSSRSPQPSENANKQEGFVSIAAHDGYKPTEDEGKVCDWCNGKGIMARWSGDGSWDDVPCPECLAMRPAAVDEKHLIRRIKGIMSNARNNWGAGGDIERAMAQNIVEFLRPYLRQPDGYKTGKEQVHTLPDKAATIEKMARALKTKIASTEEKQTPFTPEDTEAWLNGLATAAYEAEHE